MKKLLGVLASLGLMTTAGTAVVACNKQKEVSDTSKVSLKTKLPNLNLNNLQCVDSETVLLGRVLDLNQSSGVKTTDVQITDFRPASYTHDGSARIEAKPNSRFKGEVLVKINALDQINLAEVLYGKLILGYFTNDTAVKNEVQSIIDNNPKLKGKVTVDDPKNGKVHIEANDDSLTGNVDFLYKLIRNVKDLLKGQLDLGYVENDNEAIDVAVEILCDLEIRNHVTLSQPKDDKIHVKANDISLTGEADFTYHQQRSIPDLLGDDLDLGYVENDEVAMQKAKELVNGNQFLKDHVNLEKAGNGLIMVTPKDDTLIDSAILTYSLKQTIEDIIDKLVGDFDLGYVKDKEEALNKAQDIIDGIPALKDKVTISIKEDGKVHVEPKDDSLTGEADFTYKLKQNVAVLLKDHLDLGFAKDKEAALKKAQDIIDGIPALKDKVIVSIKDDNKINVKANHESLIGEVDLNYSLQQTIEDIIDKLVGDLDLGYVKDKEEALKKVQDIIDGIPALKDKVTISIKEDGKVHVEPKDDSLTGEVDFTYKLKKDVKAILDELKIETNLGTFYTDEQAVWKVGEIIKGTPQLKQKVSIGEPKDNKILVEAADESLMGEAYFTYQLSKDLNAIIHEDQRDLKVVKSHDEAKEKVLAILKEANISSKDVTIRIVKANNEIVVSANAASLKGKVTFTYQLSIASLLEKWANIGTVKDEAEALRYANVRINAIPELKGRVDLSTPENGEILVTVKPEANDKLVGEAKFTYEIEEQSKKEQLSKVIKTTDLKELDNNDNGHIVRAVEALNSLVKGQIVVKEGTITQNSAIIIPKNDKSIYTGEVKVTFTVKNKNLKKLSEIITNKDLKTISNNGDQEITKAVKKNNPKSADKFTVKKDWTTVDSAILVAKENSGYTGEVKVTFKANNDVRKTLKDLIIENGKSLEADNYWLDLGHFSDFGGYVHTLYAKINEIPELWAPEGEKTDRRQVGEVEQTGAGNTGQVPVTSIYYPGELIFIWASGDNWNS